MKYLTKLFSLVAIASLVIFMSCGPDPGTEPPTDPPGQANGELLSASNWAPSNVTLDGSAREEWSEAGFTLSFTVNADFTGGNFTASNVPDFPDANLAWPASGTWSFDTNSDGEVTESTVNTIIRNDGEEMNLNVSGTSLTLSFTVEDPAGKVDGFVGQWNFTFSAN